MGNSLGRWGMGLLAVAVASAMTLCLPALRGQPLCLDEHVSYYSSGAPSLAELWERTEKVTVLPPLSPAAARLSRATAIAASSALSGSPAQRTPI